MLPLFLFIAKAIMKEQLVETDLTPKIQAPFFSDDLREINNPFELAYLTRLIEQAGWEGN